MYHMIIFNDSISNFYQCSMRGFCQGIPMFFSICLGKKILSNLKKNMSPRINHNFLKKRKAVFHLIKKLFLSLTRFSNINCTTQIIYYIIHRCLYSFLVFFCSIVSVSKKWNIEVMLTIPYSYNW